MTTVDLNPDGHVADELPLLLAGEADRETVRRVGAHLRACLDCRDDLVDAVISHATLRSAAVHAPDVATGGRLTFGAVDVPALIDEAVERTPARAAVDLSPVFAQIRAEVAAESAPAVAATPSTPPTPPATAAAEPAPVASAPVASAPVDELAARRGLRGKRILAAAAAVVVIGGGTAVAVTTLSSDDGRQVPVAAFGVGTVPATAQVGDGWMKLDASSLKKLGSDQFYEAWLIDAKGTGILALGPLGSDGKATFSVPSDIMSNYSTLQVTVQDNDGNPAPSDTSVLRASL